MAELSVFEKQNKEVFDIVNNNHRDVLDDERTCGLSGLKKIILSRITGSGQEFYSKKTIIYFCNSNDEKYIIKAADGTLIGEIAIGEALKSKIEIVNNKPIFVIYRGNEVYLRKDITSGKILTSPSSKQEMHSSISESIKAHEKYNFAEDIYSLIENKSYDIIDPYIAYSLEQLIVENDLDSTTKEKREAYTQAYVLARNIYRLKTELLDRRTKNVDYDDIDRQLKFYYQEICKIFINVGLNKMPQNEEELITKR